MRFRLIFSLLCAVCSIAVSKSASALVCGESSPRLLELGNQTYFGNLGNYPSDADSTDLNSLLEDRRNPKYKPAAMLSSLLDELLTRELPDGTGERTRCLSRQGVEGPESESFTVTDVNRTRTLSGMTRLEAEEENRQIGNRRLGGVDVPVWKEWKLNEELDTLVASYRFHVRNPETPEIQAEMSPNPLDPVPLDPVSTEPDSLHMTNDLAQNNSDTDLNVFPGCCSRVFEIESRIRWIGKYIEFTETTYINGQATGWTTWRL